jgi:hypothetical protein
MRRKRPKKEFLILTIYGKSWNPSQANFTGSRANRVSFFTPKLGLIKDTFSECKNQKGIFNLTIYGKSWNPSQANFTGSRTNRVSFLTPKLNFLKKDDLNSVCYAASILL